MRTQKADSTGTTDYYYDSDKNLIGLTKGNDTLLFYYDYDGNVTSFKYDNAMYYYVKNLQGDVVKTINQAGTVYASYVYDAWGNIKSVSGEPILRELNPFRYRSYVYDTESGLYYLQSRYYDPFTGRFINADDTAYIGVTGTVLSANLFSYCENNPVIKADYNGKWVHIAIGALVGGLIGILGYFVVGFATAILDNKKFKFDFWQFFWSFVGGTLSGALSATSGAKIIQKIGSAIISFTSSLASGATVIETVFITLVSVMIANTGGAGKQFKKLSKNLIKKLKNPKNVKKIVKGIIYYIKSTSKLYNKYFKSLFNSNAKTWAAQFGYKFATKRR